MTSSSQWSNGPWISVDTETTGTSLTSDRIIELAAVIMDASLELQVTHRWIIDPGVPIPPGATAVHGYTDEFVQANGVAPAEALQEFAEVLTQHAGLPVVIYNARFDWPLLTNEALRHGITLPEVPLIDPLVIDKALDRYRKGPRTLTAATQHYDVEFAAQDAHSAVVDATVSAQLAYKLVEAFPEFAEQSLEELQAWQREAADTQTLSYMEYRRRTDPSFTSPTGWPIPEGALLTSAE